VGNKANKNRHKLAKDAGRRRHVKRNRDRHGDKLFPLKGGDYPPRNE